RSIVAGLIAIVAMGLPETAESQQIGSPYDFVERSQGIRAFGGYVLTDRGTIDIGPGSAPGFGAGYNIRISGPFNFDAQATYLPTSRRVYDISTDTAGISDDPRAGLVELGEADLDLLLLDATLRFDLTGPRTWYRLQPYAQIGAGGVFAVSSNESVEAGLPEDVDLRVRFENGFTGHVGAGVEWHPSEAFSIRADARDTLWKLHVPDGFFQPGRSIDSEEWVQNLNVSLGLVVRF
ncbi:MAG TPA: outer membrane beta-barrel protein, partial [Longimicrobiales bacterium]|nr:outer membrane beta-barrel protein [Longimicrobiales bacterium]